MLRVRSLLGDLRYGYDERFELDTFADTRALDAQDAEVTHEESRVSHGS